MRHFILVSWVVLLASCAGNETKPVDAKDDIYCLQHTGSQITTKPGQCNGPGRVVTREEMERSGAFTTFDALRMTVPEVR